MTFKDFTAGDIFTADDADLLMKQGLIVVANEAARDAIPAPFEGMRVYRIDTHRVDYRTATGWLTGAGVVVAVDPAMTGGAIFAYALDGMFLIEGSATGTFAANVTTNVGLIPLGHRPSGSRGNPSAWSNGEFGWGEILASGVIRVRKPTAGSSTVYLQAVYSR